MALEAQRVRDGQGDVGHGHDAEERAKEKGQRQARSAQHDRADDSGPHWEAPRGDGSLALPGVVAVPFQVHQIVHKVGRAGEQTEEEEGGRAGQEQVQYLTRSAGVPRLVDGKDEGNVDDAVLGPLPGPRGCQERGEEACEALHGGAIIGGA